MTRPRTDAEAGRGLRPDPAEPAPEAVRHVVETIDDSHDDHEGPPFDRCIHCGHASGQGGVNPFERCPAREHPSAIEVRAEAAKADEGQAVLTVGTRTESMLGVPSNGGRAD